MSYLFADSFDHYAIGDITEYWVSDTGQSSLPATGRCGTNCYRSDSSTTNTPTLVGGFANAHERGLVGFAYRPSGNHLNDNGRIFTVTDAAGDEFFTVAVQSDGSIKVWTGRASGSSSTLRITSPAGLLNEGIYDYLELRWRIHDTLGEVELFVNRVSHGNVSGIDTIPPTIDPLPPWTSIQFREIFDSCIDDFSIQNGDGSIHNALASEGDTHWESVLAETDAVGGAGDLADFTPSAGGDRGAMVDENPPDDDTTHNESTLVGNRDSHTIPSLTFLTSGVIKAVIIAVNARKTDDISDRSLATVVRQNGSTFDGATQPIANTYRYYFQVYELDPDTAAAWTVGGFNSLQPGYLDAA